jgi:hypothetical protein
MEASCVSRCSGWRWRRAQGSGFQLWIPSCKVSDVKNTLIWLDSIYNSSWSNMNTVVCYCYRSGLWHFHRHCYRSSPLWFIVGGTKALVRTSWMNTRVYMVWPAGPLECNTIHPQERVVLLCVCGAAQGWVELAPRLGPPKSRPGSYIIPQGPTGGPGVAGNLL